MRPNFSILRPLGIALALAAASTGCDTPCVTLGHQICNCETSEAAQQSCTTAVDDRAKKVSPSDAEEKACSALLDTCTCDALAAGDLAACGLTEPAGE